jgi:hypothetical protein
MLQKVENISLTECCNNPAWNRTLQKPGGFYLLGYPSDCDNFQVNDCPNAKARLLPLLHKGDSVEIDPINGSTTPTPETGQGSTIPFTPFTNKILKTPESTTIIQTPSVESFNLDPKLIFLGLGIILLLGLSK